MPDTKSTKGGAAKACHAGGHLVAGVTALALLCVAGCVTTGSLLCLDSDAPPTGVATQVFVWWHPQVIFPPDIKHDGTPIPALAARLYLFGPNLGYPLAGDGKVVVELFDPAQQPPNGQPVPQTIWTLDNAMLKPGFRRADLGWGYTLVLPWDKYRPDMTQVTLRVRYEPTKGTPLFAEPQVLKFDPAQVQDFQVSNRTGQASEVLKTTGFAVTGNELARGQGLH